MSLNSLIKSLTHRIWLHHSSLSTLRIKTSEVSIQHWPNNLLKCTSIRYWKDWTTLIQEALYIAISSQGMYWWILRIKVRKSSIGVLLISTIRARDSIAELLQDTLSLLSCFLITITMTTHSIFGPQDACLQAWCLPKNRFSRDKITTTSCWR